MASDPSQTTHSILMVYSNNYVSLNFNSLKQI